jgi:hypothetical protein
MYDGASVRANRAELLKKMSIRCILANVEAARCSFDILHRPLPRPNDAACWSTGNHELRLLGKVCAHNAVPVRDQAFSRH